MLAPALENDFGFSVFNNDREVEAYNETPSTITIKVATESQEYLNVPSPSPSLDGSSKKENTFRVRPLSPGRKFSSSSPYFDRLSSRETACIRLKKQARDQDEESHVERPPLPRHPSPFHDRLSGTGTKATQLRHRETTENIRKSKESKKLVPFYCTVSSSTESVDSLDFQTRVSMDDTRTISSSMSSLAGSDDVSYEKEKKQWTSPRARDSSTRVASPFYDRVASSRNASSPLHDRLASTNTKSVGLRRLLEKADNERRILDRHDGPAFYYRASASNTSKVQTPTRKRCVSPRAGFHSYLAKTETYSTARKKGLIETQQPKPTTPKKSAKELDQLYNRLCKHDTINSSKNTVNCPQRPVRLSAYEQSEMVKKAMIQEERKKKRTSQAFFDVLSVDATLSLLYKQYEMTKQVVSGQEESNVW